jgi:hypothetical protein
MRKKTRYDEMKGVGEENYAMVGLDVLSTWSRMVWNRDP